MKLRVSILIIIFSYSSLWSQVTNRDDAYDFNKNLGKGANFMAAKVDGRFFDVKDAELLLENNFNHIRLGAKLNKYIAAAPDYTIDADRIKDLQDYIDILLEKGLMVVLDPIHQYNEDYTDALLPALKSIWKQVAEAFKDYPLDLLCFEIMNEPHDDYNLFDLVNESLDEIRSIPENEQRIVIVSGQGFSTRQALINAFDNDIFPSDDAFLIGTFHYYDPRPFTKQGTFGIPVDWADGGDDDPEWDTLSAAFDKVEEANNKWASRKYTIPLPVYLGEFGADNAIAFNDRIRWLWWVRNQAEKRNFSHALWNMYNDNPSSKGIGPWTSLQKDDPSTRSLDSDFVEALTGRYEIEEGEADINASTINTTENTSGSSVLLSGQGTGITIPGIYIGRSGTYNLYLRYRIEGANNGEISILTRKQNDPDFTYTSTLSLGNSSTALWSHKFIPVQFDADHNNVLRIELTTNEDIEVDFIAISSGQYFQLLYASDLSLSSMLHNQTNKVRITPNPVVSNTFTLNFQEFREDLLSDLNIIDSSGRTVFRASNIQQGSTINLPAELSNGIYIVECYNNKYGTKYIDKLSLIRK